MVLRLKTQGFFPYWDGITAVDVSFRVPEIQIKTGGGDGREGNGFARMVFLM